MVMSKRKIPNGGKKGTRFGGPKERKARRPCQKENDGFHNEPDKGAQWQRKGSKRKRQRKELFFNPDSQPQKHPMKKGMARPGNQTIGLPAIGQTIPGLQMLGGSFCT